LNDILELQTVVMVESLESPPLPLLLLLHGLTDEGTGANLPPPPSFAILLGGDEALVQLIAIAKL
jgi:hypothetical protein